MKGDTKGWLQPTVIILGVTQLILLIFWLIGEGK